MRFPFLRPALTTGAVLLVLAVQQSTHAQIITTTGAGSAVPLGTQDRIATFDTVTFGTDLTNYSEGGLNVRVPAVAYIDFDPTRGNGGFSPPFHYPDNGANAFTIITPTDAVDFSALELNVGTGYGLQQAFLAFRVLNNGLLLDSGALTIAAGQVFGVVGTGGVVFDEVRLGVYFTLAEALAATDNSLQVLAADTVRVNLAGSSSVAIPEPGTLALLLAGTLTTGAGFRRRKRTEAA